MRQRERLARVVRTVMRSPLLSKRAARNLGREPARAGLDRRAGRLRTGRSRVANREHFEVGRVMEMRNEIVIHASPARIFAYASDTEHWPEYLRTTGTCAFSNAAQTARSWKWRPGAAGFRCAGAPSKETIRRRRRSSSTIWPVGRRAWTCSGVSSPWPGERAFRSITKRACVFRWIGSWESFSSITSRRERFAG